ncbi:nucleotide-diphospho-sugar transferase [Dichotomocladium elegans]|nr:nucleotide-diphospho-sugar transferase [Dichotomocladium elegans]
MAFIHSFRKRNLIVAFVVGTLLVLGFMVMPSTPSFRNHLRKESILIPPYANPEELHQPNPLFKAAYVTFTKSDGAALANLRMTMRQLEDNVNRQLGYPFLIFSDEPLSDEFKTLARAMTESDVAFYDGLDREYYGYRNTTDLAKAANARVQMKDTIFGDSEDYRFGSRFMAGKLFEHPAMIELDYYWRFEIGTEYICPLDFDPFQYMYDHKKKLSFSIALYEYEDTIPTLFQTVMQYASMHTDSVQSTRNPKSLWHFVLDEETQVYNRCHFWSNFQIADLSFFRSTNYRNYFEYLDEAGGFFYERWGDPVIHTLGAVLFLEKDEVHFWDTIGYRVANHFTHCPPDYHKCSCRPQQNFDQNDYSCLMRF